MSSDEQWLPHLKNSIPNDVRGYSLSQYSMTLEAWRRGIDVTFINKNRRRSELYYRLSYQGKSHIFTVAKGDLVTNETIKICKDKDKTKQILKDSQVSIPEGKVFKDNENNEKLIRYANKLSYPVVLKPLDGTGGKGVISNIKNEEEFKEALYFVKEELDEKKLIIEKYINGEDYRLYVVDGEVIGGIKRLPANIIGDGKSTIKELTNKKTKERDKNPSLKKRPIKIDTELRNMIKRHGYTLDSIPKKDEFLYLKSKNNVSAGGESIDVTDELPDKIKDIAISAANAIPGFVHGGVDIMFDDKTNIGAVLELNSMPHITAQLFPWKGKARDIPKALIDYYFPETKTNDYKDMYYYDFDIIWETFRKGMTKEIKLPVLPIGLIESKLFIVTGDILRKNYGSKLRNIARDLQLNGYVKLFNNNQISIVTSGNTDSIKHFQQILQEEKISGNISGIKEKSRTSPVKVGFEIINHELDIKIKDGYFPVRLSGISKLGQKQKNIKKTSSTLKMNYRKKYNDLVSSRSWKITKPLRKIKQIIKK